MELETDLNWLKEMALERQEENLQFREFLLRMDSRELDTKVHGLNEQVSASIDCTTCGNCCRSFIVSLDEADKKRLEDHLGVASATVNRKYLEKSQMGQWVFSHIPCSFLKDNRCTVYSARPADCRDYPHLHQDRINAHLQAILGSYGICPIVYNVMEMLKEETGFLRDGPDPEGDQ